MQQRLFLSLRSSLCGAVLSAALALSLPLAAAVTP
jgi:hypothetical protein